MSETTAEDKKRVGKIYNPFRFKLTIFYISKNLGRFSKGINIKKQLFIAFNIIHLYSYTHSLGIRGFLFKQKKKTSNGNSAMSNLHGAIFDANSTEASTYTPPTTFSLSEYSSHENRDCTQHMRRDFSFTGERFDNEIVDKTLNDIFRL